MINSKIKFIFGIYFSLLIVSACCDTETFNVQITEIEFHPLNTYVAKGENFEFNLREKDSIVGMACNLPELKLISSAYAYDCDDEDTFRPIATVDDMKIKILTNFSEEYQANDFITELIDVRFFNWRTERIETKSLEDFFHFLRQDDRATGRSAELQNATYIISERPTVKNEQEFEIEFIFTDESSLKTLTEKISWE